MKIAGEREVRASPGLFEPARQRPHFELTHIHRSPGSALHVMLAAEYEQHVHADVVESDRPVFGHPFPRVLVYELILEVEYVRIVGRGERVQVVAVHGDRG